MAAAVPFAFWTKAEGVTFLSDGRVDMDAHLWKWGSGKKQV